MRTAGGVTSRAAYYDRNASTIVNTASNFAVAPHALTQRWSYTVPAGRKAYFESSSSLVHVVTVSAPNGQRSAKLRINTGTLASLMRNDLYNNTVDASSTQNSGQLGLALAGHILDFADSDLGTGGTVDFVGEAKFTEFDA